MLNKVVETAVVAVGTSLLGSGVAYTTNMLIDMYSQPDTRGCHTDKEYAAAIRKHEKRKRIAKPIINCVEVGLIGTAVSLGVEAAEKTKNRCNSSLINDAYII